MPPRSIRHAVRTALLSFWVSGLLTVIPCSVSAQTGGLESNPGDPGTSGVNSIQGDIYLPSGRRLDKRIEVKLNTLRRGVLSTMTDGNGEFSFRRLAPGQYTVLINTKDYEPVSESVEIGRTPRSDKAAEQVFTLQIHLVSKLAKADKPSVINVEFAGVPTAALQLYSHALELAKNGLCKAAIEELQKAISVYPQFVMAFNEMGVQHIRLGEFPSALEDFRHALKLEPTASIPQLNYGIVLVLEKRYQEAEKELRKAVSRDEMSAQAHYYLGRTLANLRYFADAQKELLLAIDLGGDEVKEAHRYLGAVYNAQGNSRAAIAELEMYLRLSPQVKDAPEIRKIIAGLESEIRPTTEKQPR